MSYKLPYELRLLINDIVNDMKTGLLHDVHLVVEWCLIRYKIVDNWTRVQHYILQSFNVLVVALLHCEKPFSDPTSVAL